MFREAQKGTSMIWIKTHAVVNKFGISYLYIGLIVHEWAPAFRLLPFFLRQKEHNRKTAKCFSSHSSSSLSHHQSKSISLHKGFYFSFFYVVQHSDKQTYIPGGTLRSSTLHYKGNHPLIYCFNAFNGREESKQGDGLWFVSKFILHLSTLLVVANKQGNRMMMWPFLRAREGDGAEGGAMTTFQNNLLPKNYRVANMKKNNTFAIKKYTFSKHQHFIEQSKRSICPICSFAECLCQTWNNSQWTSFTLSHTTEMITFAPYLQNVRLMLL